MSGKRLGLLEFHNILFKERIVHREKKLKINFSYIIFKIYFSPSCYYFFNFLVWFYYNLKSFIKVLMLPRKQAMH